MSCAQEKSEALGSGSTCGNVSTPQGISMKSGHYFLRTSENMTQARAF